MHPIALYLTGTGLTVLLGATVWLVIRSPATMDRVLALDTASFILIALLALFGHATGSPYYLDAALVLALLSFVVTIAAARYGGDERVFS
jgi:multisubunit Na+/H+ antiporter MnhF subunit